MTDIEQKAHTLLLTAQGEYPNCDPYTAAVLVLERAIEAHEATKQELSDYKQKVSDAVELSIDRSGHDGLRAGHINEYLGRFIIPTPKPDPLVEAMADCGVDRFESWADQLRAALDARGLEIREKNDDQ